MRREVTQKTGAAFTKLLISLLFFPYTLLAQQAPPDAGVLQQQIERNQPTVLPKKSLPKKEAKAPKVSPKGAMTVVVKQFRFVGNHLVSQEELSSVVAPYLKILMSCKQQLLLWLINIVDWGGLYAPVYHHKILIMEW